LRNVHGLWRLTTDEDGKKLSNHPRDTTKFEHLIASMKVKCLDVYFLQDTWLEYDEFDVDIRGYHVFRHNGPNGNHLHHGVAIVLSPRYYAGWKAAGAAPPITTDTTSEFMGRFIGITIKKATTNVYYRWYWPIIHAALRMTTKDFLMFSTPSSANYRRARLLWVLT